MALSYDDFIKTEGKQKLIDKAKNNECWPSPTCDIKSTALAALALNIAGENTDNAAEWLLSKKTAYTTSGITWLLQIDSEEATNCTIRYDSNYYTVLLNKERKYSWSGKSSPCLIISSNGYWLEIAKSRDCLGKSYNVSCTQPQPAIVSLPYRSGSTLFVPSESQTTPATVSIKTICLGEGSLCQYEDTLWAAYALQKIGKNSSALIPYLVDQKDSNSKYIPEAFLYMITAKTEYIDNLTSMQSRDGYWSDVGGNGKYYDTALAAGAIKEFAESNFSQAKEWLIKENNQGKWGITSELRDTAMVLAFVWASEVTALPTNECEEVNAFTCRDSCLEDEEQTTDSCGLKSGVCCKPKGFEVQCTTTADCRKSGCNGALVKDDNGNTGRCEYPAEVNCEDDFDNDGDTKIDYSDSDCSKTCSDKGGAECAQNEVCSTTPVKSLDKAECCIGVCKSGAEATCAEQNGYDCKSGQKCDQYLTASDTLTCCKTKCKSGSSIIYFIIIAAVLAIGAALFFLYKKGYLQRFLPKKKTPFNAAMITGYRPPVKPLSPQMQPMQSPSQIKQPVNVNIKFQPPQQQSYQRPVRQESKELDETMKKLKKLAEK
jgi:hypothetical protein